MNEVSPALLPQQSNTTIPTLLRWLQRITEISITRVSFLDESAQYFFPHIFSPPPITHAGPFIHVLFHFILKILFPNPFPFLKKQDLRFEEKKYFVSRTNSTIGPTFFRESSVNIPTGTLSPGSIHASKLNVQLSVSLDFSPRF